MKSERFRRIDEVFQLAVKLPPERWSSFLAAACGQDRDLRAEVESLLTAHQEAGNFIAGSASDAATALLESDWQQPAEVGQYKIERLIGAGGMGRVYLAEDPRLRRRVALKLLPVEFCKDRQRAARFLREAQAASALNHPNICTIHEINEHNDVTFIAMEYVEGRTLSEKIEDGMEIVEIVDIALQVADGLAEAHSHGIVHRDVKPANIIVNSRGRVKVLDFGLAKKMATESEAETQQILSQAGMILGTAAYMSPEQARGTPVDARTDVWSLGVVLYEMVAGEKPFSGSTTTDLLAAILTKEPESLRKFNHEVPLELERLVMKALCKDRDERYKSAQPLFSDLEQLKRGLEFGNKHAVSSNLSKEALSEAYDKGAALKLGTPIELALEERSYPTKPVAIEAMTKEGQTADSSVDAGPAKRTINRSAAIVAIPILALAAVGFALWSNHTRNSTARQINSLAVMPFVNESGSADVEYLSDGMTESLINSLSRLPRLSVKARSSVFRYKGKNIEPQQVASELSVQAVLNGRVVQRGDDLTLYLSLVDARDGSQLWGEQYNRKLADLLTLQGDIARDVSRNVQARLSGADEQRLSKGYTTNTEAYQLYLKGHYHFARLTVPELQTGISYFQKAIEVDPGYAVAYAGLANSYRALTLSGEMPPTELLPKAKLMAQKAVALDDSLGEGHAALGIVTFFYDWKWTEAENEFKRALELDPNSSDTHQFYAIMLMGLGRSAEAVAEIKRAVELDPLNLLTNAQEAQILFYAGQYDQALASARKASELDPNYWFAHFWASAAYTEKGMFSEAIEEASKSRQVLRVGTHQTAFLAYALAKSGQQAAARAELDEVLKLSARQFVSPYNVAVIYNGLGDREQTLAWLERGYKEKDPKMVIMKVEPKWNNLRDDPRFINLLQRMNFPP
ncbi:MAG TPA: protein kinase [Pyrinomonadaceae bacterium]